MVVNRPYWLAAIARNGGRWAVLHDPATRVRVQGIRVWIKPSATSVFWDGIWWRYR